MGTVTIGVVLTSLLCGGLLGFILQRGRLCVNTAFRDVIFIKDFTLFRAFLLALAVMIVGANAIGDLGLIELKSQSFFPLANIIGGYLFGLGMVLASGCGSGIFFKTGEGQIAAGVAVVGFSIGIGATMNGIFNPAYNLLRSWNLDIAGVSNATLYNIFGDSMEIKWIVIAVVTLAIFLFILKDKPFSLPKTKQKGFYWSVTGVLVGLVGILTFWASQRWGGDGGFARGMNFTTPTGELFFTVVTGDAHSKFFPMLDLGSFKVTWAEFFIVGVPLGSFLSAKLLKEFCLKLPGARDIITVFLAGILMGFGAVTCGGCNIGQGLTGSCTLSIASIAATMAMILGNWTMVYFRFIRPMNDM